MLTLLLILIPLLGGLILLAVREKSARQIAPAISLATLALATATWVLSGRGDGMLFTLDVPWVPVWGIAFRLGLDGISMPLILLVGVITPVALLLASRRTDNRSAALYALILAMEAGLMGVFAARDAVVFYLFWELALVPVYFIAAFWGGEKRVAVTLKFLIYTVAGSLFMLFGILYVYTYTLLPHSFSLESFYTAALPSGSEVWLLLAFFVAFAIKMPVFPFHTWQSDTYHEAPAAGTVLLAALMAKMGVYGVIRWMLPVLPSAATFWQPVLMGLSVTGIVWGSLAALAQSDMKRLLAWSSFSHTGLMAAGVFSLGAAGLQGSVVQMVAHGLSIAGLFLAVDMIETHTGSRRIGAISGLAHRNGTFAVLFVILALSAIGLPLTAGFVGEFLLLLAVSKIALVYALLGGVGVILGAVLYLQWIRRTFLGPKPADVADFKMGRWEGFALGALALGSLVLGVFPKPILEGSAPALSAILQLLAAR